MPRSLAVVRLSYTNRSGRGIAAALFIGDASIGTAFGNRVVGCTEGARGVSSSPFRALSHACLVGSLRGWISPSLPPGAEGFRARQAVMGPCTAASRASERSSALDLAHLPGNTGIVPVQGKHNRNTAKHKVIFAEDQAVFCIQRHARIAQ